MRTVIFDLDGTLADTSADLVAAANARFHAAGHAPQLDAEADKATAFTGVYAMMRLGYGRLGIDPDDATLNRDYHAFLADYAEILDNETWLYPGAVEAVEVLRAEGFAVGICTNKPSGLAEDLMRKLGVRDLFGSLIGADTLPVRKPDPAPYRAAVEGAGGAVERSFLVGDTVTDERTARAAGVPLVLVTFGAEGQGIKRLAADAYLDAYADLPALAARLLD